MHPWEIGNEADDKLNCFDNANYNDEALKKCVHLSAFNDWLNECDYCCNRDICEKYTSRPEIKIDTISEIKYYFGDERPLYVTSDPILSNYLNYMGRWD